ncbi:methyltransferase [Streptomyces sp. A1499]|uniref:methyltransferase n=1 Tax=Streptomyces sp. A1499 TaxID=2563104 RepID=UPI00109E5763|nr:methyltransferase [Streptomyces sp. A1499]THC52406.1 SAM-dependent methyltransferase [Streptomyces sp. A1499]
MDTPETQDVTGQLVEHALGHLFSAALRTAARCRVADHLAAGPRTARELAGATGADAGHLRRVLRYLATRGVFREDRAGAFHLTPTGEALRADVPHSQHAAVLMLTDPTFQRTSAALEETVRKAGPSFERLFGEPFFTYLARDPELREVFDSGMTSLSARVDAVVAGTYPFPEHGRVVDVGGGRGGLLLAVLRGRPGLSGVLFDQTPAISTHVLSGEEAVRGRWSAESGDFFTTVPEGGDVYVLKHVLHDWPDEGCLRVLRNCRAAMAPGARVVIVESVLPEGNAPHPGKAMDLAMAAVVNGQERTREEFAALLAAAELRLTRVLPTAAFLSVVEAVAA